MPDAPDNVNFFTVHYHRGLEWYERTYFSRYAGEPVLGEFSNSYMCYPPALERIARDLHDVRLTLTLRNPVERYYLSWAHIHLKPGSSASTAQGISIRSIASCTTTAAFYRMDRRASTRGTCASTTLRATTCSSRSDTSPPTTPAICGAAYFLSVDTDVPISLVGEDVNPTPRMPIRGRHTRGPARRTARSTPGHRASRRCSRGTSTAGSDPGGIPMPAPSCRRMMLLCAASRTGQKNLLTTATLRGPRAEQSGRLGVLDCRRRANLASSRMRATTW